MSKRDVCNLCKYATTEIDSYRINSKSDKHQRPSELLSLVIPFDASEVTAK